MQICGGVGLNSWNKQWEFFRNWIDSKIVCNFNIFQIHTIKITQISQFNHKNQGKLSKIPISWNIPSSLNEFQPKILVTSFKDDQKVWETFQKQKIPAFRKNSFVFLNLAPKERGKQLCRGLSKFVVSSNFAIQDVYLELLTFNLIRNLLNFHMGQL
jgi:hypothetical protein